MKMKQIWIICDDCGEAIATPTWEAVIHGWISRWHITGDVRVYDEAINEWRPLKDMYGDDWQSVLIAFSYKDFNNLFDNQFYAYQIPYYEE